MIDRASLFSSPAAALLVAFLAVACASTHDGPCAGKRPGDTCRVCPPDDGNCVETQQIKTCNTDGACGGSYVCPADGTIDCMPVVPEARKHLCSGSYSTWVHQHCPGVKFVQ